VVKKIKVITTFVLAFALVLFAIESFANKTINFNNTDTTDNFDYIETQFLSSSRFTQPTKTSQEEIDNYKDNYLIRYEVEKLTLLGYELALQNDNYLLYFENDSYSVVLIDRHTNFIWSSRAEFQQMSDGNNTARNRMNSGIWIDYININSSAFRETNATIYGQANVDYYLDGEVEEEIRPYLIKENTYNKNRVSVSSSISNQVIESEINFKDLGISFTVLLTLEDSGINVNLLNETIIETTDNIKLTSIYLLPYFGSTRENNVPGYMIIPDGVGALVRFNDTYNQNFDARFYGNDRGYTQRYLPELSLPIYGSVHLEGDNAMYATINEGAENSLLQARFWGTSGRYFRISQRFVVRNIYQTIIDRAGNGYSSLLDETLNSNYNVTYTFLKGDAASYIGISKDYQNKLVSQGVLKANNEIDNNDNIPINLEFILSERENAIIGTKKLTMTSTNELLNIYNNLKGEGLTNQVISVMGYSSSGNYQKTPYKMNFVESNKKIKALTSSINEDNNQIYLVNDYTYGSSNSNRINYNRDVARTISRTRMSNRTFNLNDSFVDIYRLYPNRSLGYAKSDVNKVYDLGFNGLSLDRDTSEIYSYYQSGNYYSRTDSLEYYDQMYKLYDQSLMKNPNLYALKYASAYLEMPITNTQYDYYSDLVPLIPLILKGYLSYFTPNLNFNALGIDRILMMVDFGLNPSYILTEKETYEMRFTESNVYYSTTYSNYHNEIVETYHYLNDALKYVINETIVNREVLKVGVVKVTYSNGVNIIINYTNQNYNDSGLIVSPKSYEVIHNG